MSCLKCTHKEVCAIVFGTYYNNPFKDLIKPYIKVGKTFVDLTEEILEVLPNYCRFYEEKKFEVTVNEQSR